MKEALKVVNDPNNSNDMIYINEENAPELNDEIKVKKDEIILNDALNKEKFENIKKDKKEEINSAKLFSLQIEDISFFDNLMSFLEEKKIKKFSFYENSLNADFEGWENIYEFLEKNFAIRYIDLHDNNIDDNHLYEIMRVICDKRIKYLDLIKNNITYGSALIFSDFLKNNKTLQYLDLSHNSFNNFKPEGVKIILESLKDSPSIKSINFSYMHLTKCGEYIGNFITLNKSIEKIILRNIQLNIMDFKNIFENLKSNENVKELDISMNDKGGDKSLEYIADCIKKNTSLNTLKIDKISINNDNYKIYFRRD